MYELLAKKRPVNGCGTPFEMICFFRDYDYRFTAIDLVDREIYQEALIIDDDYRCIMYVEFDKEFKRKRESKGK